MSDWTTCPQCGPRHSWREDGRCRSAPGQAPTFGAPAGFGAPPSAAPDIGRVFE